MYDEEFNRVKLYLTDNREKFEDKRIYMFGVSDNSKQIISILNNLKHIPIAVLDNDRQKQKGTCNGLPVWDISRLAVSDIKTGFFLIYSAYWREMSEQLMSLGVRQEQIHVLCKTDKGIGDYIEEAFAGEQLYSELCRRFDTDTMFLCPYTGTGDVYLIGTFWDIYVRQNNITDYVFVVISGACEKVTRLFDIKNVVLLKRKEDAACLIRYYMMNRESVKLKLLNDSWKQIHTNPIEWFRGLHGLDFRTMFCRYVFDLPGETYGQHANSDLYKTDVEELFAKLGLQAGHTVVISPYSTTLMELPPDFWRQIVEQLQSKGFVVCTNCGGEKEREIEGTIRTSFPLHYAPQFVQRAGFFVGVRSGFCDIISGTSAKKVILYDRNERFYNCSSYEYFSLAKTYTCTNLCEIELEIDDLEGVSWKIVQELLYFDKEVL